VRLSLLFFALCSALDEASTFARLSAGGVELNPRVGWLLGFNPLLYPLLDFALVSISYALDRVIGFRALWVVWASAGIARLVCLTFTMMNP